MTHSTPNAWPDPQYDAVFYDGVPTKRALAWLIDVALILASMAVLSVLSLGLFFFLWVPVHAVVAFLYRWLSLRSRSATFGMRVMNLQILGPSGRPLTSGEAALHTGVFLAGAIFVVVHLVSVALLIARPLNRNLPDHAVGTVMVNRPS